MDPEINISQTNPTTGWGANIFTAKSNEVLKAINFYTTDLNYSYIINILIIQGPIPLVKKLLLLPRMEQFQMQAIIQFPLIPELSSTPAKNFP
jgi:hypothetical protein